jgi:hypothetical protein
MKLANLLLSATLLALAGGCAADRSAYCSQRCGAGGTNVCYIVISPDGGAVLLPVGTDALKVAKDAYTASSGIGATTTVADSAGKAVTAIEAAKEAKP